jgi:hypothetical protein
MAIVGRAIVGRAFLPDIINPDVWLPPVRSKVANYVGQLNETTAIHIDGAD